MKKSLSLLTVMLAFGVTAYANIAPPPVNQTIGIPDGVFNNLSEMECRACHGGGASPYVKEGYLPDRHHLRVGKPVITNSDAPFSSAGTEGTGSQVQNLYACLSCHNLVMVNGSYQFEPFRDCNICHIQVGREATVHHRTLASTSLMCKACHSYIDNPSDGHTIPTYQGSLVTPNTGYGDGGTGPGGCAYCHNKGTEGTFQVYTNAQTHHGTGVKSYPTKCSLCHEESTDGIMFPKIRRCEKCHGINSLHNIALDTNGDGVKPGQELPGRSHVGNQSDCWGCHGFQATAVASDVANAIIPYVSTMSTQSVRVGSNAPITLNGSAFTNEYMGGIISSTVRFRKNDGVSFSEVVIAPGQMTEGSTTVTLPPYVSSGSYRVSLLKDQQKSNTLAMNVLPKMTVKETTCRVDGNWTFVVITGSGFGAYSEGMAAINSGIGVSWDGVTCGVNTWMDTEIVSSCRMPCPTDITVSGLWDVQTVKTGNVNVCLTCHSAMPPVTCNALSAHLRRNMIDSATFTDMTKQYNLPCVTPRVLQPKARNRK
jgi:hypothetical protein